MVSTKSNLHRNSVQVKFNKKQKVLAGTLPEDKLDLQFIVFKK